MIIGIDLGTTNSLAAYFDGDKPVLIPNRQGQFLTPSVVSVDTDGTLLVGEGAKQRAMLTPNCSASVFKRAMGTDSAFTLSGQSFTAEELSSFVLRSLKEDAEVFLGQPVTEAIISVPAYFNDHQRRATRKAGELAGFAVERIINEPTAAALAYGMQTKRSGRFLVFDLGGGTFDVSVLELDGSIMEVQSIAGDNFLGGEDFTELIAQLFLQKCGHLVEGLTYGELAELVQGCEMAKQALSDGLMVSIETTIGGQRVQNVISRMEFESASASLFAKMQAPIQRSLRDAGLTPTQLDEILLVGGATKSPMVRQFAAKLLGKAPITGIDPDLAVALGAAMQCGMKQRNEAVREVILTDVCPFTLGTSVVHNNGLFDEGNHYLPIIERNTVIPASRQETLYTVRDDQPLITVDILQGESRIASENLKLGELEVPVPKAPRGKEGVKVRYTYDINSMLQVEVEVLSTGVQKQIVLQQSETLLSDEEVAARLKELEYLKISPRDQEENKRALMRAEALYAETTGDARQAVDRAIDTFNRALNKQDPSEIKTAREDLDAYLDMLEEGLG